MSPKSWQVVIAGVIGQLVVGIAAMVTAGSGLIGLLAGSYLVAVALVAGATALVPFGLLLYGRAHRLAAGFAVSIGVGILWVTEFALPTWVLPVSLFVASVLAWREGSARTPGTSDG